MAGYLHRTARVTPIASRTRIDAGAQQTVEQLTAVCAAGGTTVITAEPATVLGYLDSGGL